MTDTIHNTGNPVPSVHPKDRDDNSITLDIVISGAVDTTITRTGKSIYTLHYLNTRLAAATGQISEIVASVDATAEAAKLDMETTARELGNDLNNKLYSSYAKMLADPQTRDGVTAYVDGDPDPNMDGYYVWNNNAQSWRRAQRQPIIQGRGYDGKNLITFTDANDRETWLAANAIDGGPSEHSEFMIRRMMGMMMDPRTGYLFALTDANRRMTDLSIRESDGQLADWVVDRLAARIEQRLKTIPKESKNRTGYLWAVTDKNDRMTDLCVTDDTGQFPDWVVKRLAPRIAREIPDAGGGAVLSNDTYLDANGDLHNIISNMRQWSGWGSSTIDEWVELGTVAASLGATYYNGGNGATELQHNLAQMGARPALLLPSGGEIPASGTVVVECSNVIKNSFFKHTSGTLSGVPGLLSCTATEWRFTRTNAGDPVSVSAELPFIPTQGYVHRGDFWIMNEGKNDINNGRPMDQTFAWHKLAFAWNSALTKRVIVMTHFGHTGNTNKSHTAKCKELSDFIRKTYGGQVFDLVEYLCSAEIWVDTGITPTAEDLQNQADLCLPASLSRDPAHMNPKARAAAAAKIKQKIIEMGWFTE